MPKSLFYVTGPGQALKRLYALKREIRKITTAVAVDMLAPVEAAAISRAPRDTGALAAGINRKKWRLAGQARVQTPRAGRYGGHVEFGTRGHPAQPFMLEAYEAEKDRAAQIAVTELARRINGALKGP